MRLPSTTCLLALLVVLSGCSVLPGGPPPSDERAVDVRNRTVAAVDSVSTYRYSLYARVSASDGDRTRTVTVNGEGAVDRRQRRMESTATAESDTGERSTRSLYVDGRTVYTECSDPWDGWGVESASESVDWFTLTPLGRQLELLERTNVYWGGNRTLDGNRTLLLVTHPSRRTLASLPDVGQTAGDYSRGNFANVTFKVWVDARTDRPVKSELRFELSVKDASGVGSLTTRYRAYGEPANVSLPSSTRTDRHELGCPGG